MCGASTVLSLALVPVHGERPAVVALEAQVEQATGVAEGQRREAVVTRAKQDEMLEMLQDPAKIQEKMAELQQLLGSPEGQEISQNIMKEMQSVRRPASSPAAVAALCSRRALPALLGADRPR